MHASPATVETPLRQGWPQWSGVQGPQGSARQDTAGSPSRRRPQAWLDLFVEPRTSRGLLPVSLRTVMDNVG